MYAKLTHKASGKTLLSGYKSVTIGNSDEASCTRSVKKSINQIAALLIAAGLWAPSSQASDKPEPLPCGTPKVTAYNALLKLKEFPQSIEVVPNELSVQFYLHKLPGGDTREAWSFVTEGLAKAGQPEMMMTILKRNDEKTSEFPLEPIKFFKTVLALAKDEKLVQAGDYTELSTDDKGFIAPQFIGAIYLPAKPLEGVSIPEGALAVIPITPEEMDAYKIGGASRVSGRLSNQDKFYPYPTWCDRSRKSVFSPEDIKTMKAEPINEAPTESLYTAGVSAEGTRLSLSMPSDARESLVEILKKLPDDAPLKIELGVDPRANAFLIWTSGEPRAVAPPKSKGSIVSGSYIELLPGVKKTEFARYGDGYVVMLTSEEWTKFKSAIFEKKDRSITATTGGEFIDFEVTFPMVAYRDPISHLDYNPEKDWKLYSAKGEDTLPSAKSNEKIILLTEQNLIASYIDATVLSNYILEIDKTAKDHFAETPQSIEYELVIQCDLSPENKANYAIAAKPSNLSSDLVKGLYFKLESLKVPASKGDVSFQTILNIPVKK